MLSNRSAQADSECLQLQQGQTEKKNCTTGQNQEKGVGHGAGAIREKDKE